MSKKPLPLRYRRQAGYTLTEMMVAVTIMALILTGMLSILSSAAVCFDNTRVQVFTDTDATLAMQMIVRDVREAKTITILNNSTQLRVTTPKKTADGYYNRFEPDLTNLTDFYLSDATGTLGRTGTYLWRVKTDGTKQILRKDVQQLIFAQDTTRSVEITIIAQNSAAGGTQQTRLTQRVVYLRNY